MNTLRLHKLAITFLLVSSTHATTDVALARELSPSKQSHVTSQRSSDGNVASLGNFTGLQLLPSLDGKWTPGTFSDLKPRAGILELPIGPVMLTNAFSSPNSQLGTGLKFSHELVAIKRKDGTLLVVNSRGNPVAVFDLRQAGRQTYPAAMRNSASLDPNGAELSFNTHGKLFFRKLNFSNYRGEELYLLNKLVTPGGRGVDIAFRIDDASKTAVYSKIGDIAVKGDARSGRISFQDTTKSALVLTLEYRTGRLTAARGTANEVIAEFQTSNGLVVTLIDKYGYRTKLSYSGQLWTGYCSHYGECMTSSYTGNTVSSKANTGNYTATATYDSTRGAPLRIAYAGWSTDFVYEPARSSLLPRLTRQTVKSNTGASVTSQYKYDASDRLTEYSDSTGYRTIYSYTGATDPYQEPSAITTTLAGKTIQDVRFSYTNAGLLEEVQDLLVAGTSPYRSIKYLYNEKKQLDAVRYGDGTVQDLKYEDTRFPDFTTALLTNGHGVDASFNSSGQLSAIVSVPEGARQDFGYSPGGLLTSAKASTPAFGSATSWMGTYGNGLYLASEMVQETARGGTVTTYKAQYKWDPQYRSVIATTRDNADSKTGLPSGTVPLRSFISESSLETTQTTSAKPSGVRADASGCSPCACPVETDTKTGATVPGGSQCDPSVRLQSAPGGGRNQGS
jgi:hypothetical protein